MTIVARLKESMRFLRRAISVLYPSVLGIMAAFLIIAFCVLYLDSTHSSFLRGTLLGGLTGTLLFFTRYAERCWSIVVSQYHYIFDEGSEKERESNFLKDSALRTKIGFTSFFTFLPIWGAVFLVLLGNDPDPSVSSEIVYVWAIEERDMQQNPTFTLHAPYLVFKPGALSQQGQENLAESWSEVDDGWFEELSLRLSEQQRHHLKSHLYSLQRSCQDSNQPIRVETLGFASDVPFLDRGRNRRPDSDHLNLAIANLRARHVALLIEDLATTREFRNAKLEITPKKWGSIEEMQDHRDLEFFGDLSISFSPHTDHRSVALQLALPPECQILSTDQGNQMLAVRD